MNNMLISTHELENEKYKLKVPFKCTYCKVTFFLPRKQVISMLKNTTSATGQFCSKNCYHQSMKKTLNLNCAHCQKPILKRLSESKRSKGNRSFCNKSCAGKYNQTHKKHGTNKSKLEIYVQNKLLELYPKLNFHFNQRDTINAELDIFIPSLNLAFELNGIFHYEPIFSQEKLEKTQNNDKRKILACAEKEIGLCIIDTTSMSYFKLEKANKFLQIITNLINEKLNF